MAPFGIGFREYEEGRGDGCRDGGCEGKNPFGNEEEKSKSKTLKPSFSCKGEDGVASVLASVKLLLGDIWEPMRGGSRSIPGLDNGE